MSSKNQKKQIDAIVKEHNAREAWEAQERLVNQIHDELLSLPREARKRALNYFCVDCGELTSECDCGCMNLGGDENL